LLKVTVVKIQQWLNELDYAGPIVKPGYMALFNEKLELPVMLIKIIYMVEAIS